MAIVIPSHFRRFVFLLGGILLVSGFLPKDAHAAIALVQRTSNYSSPAVTTLSKAFNSNNTAGNFIVVWTRWNSSATINFDASVSDSAGNAYQSLSPLQNASAGFKGQIFYARNIVGGANTVTVTISGNIGEVAIDILEY